MNKELINKLQQRGKQTPSEFLKSLTFEQEKEIFQAARGARELLARREAIISSAEKAVKFVKTWLPQSELDNSELLAVLYLDTQNKLIAKSKHLASSTFAKHIAAEGLELNARSIILVTYGPLSARLRIIREKLEYVDIKLLDHLVSSNMAS